MPVRTQRRARPQRTRELRLSPRSTGRSRPASCECRRRPVGHFTKRIAESWLRDARDDAQRGSLPGLTRTATTSQMRRPSAAAYALSQRKGGKLATGPRCSWQAQSWARRQTQDAGDAAVSTTKTRHASPRPRPRAARRRAVSSSSGRLARTLGEDSTSTLSQCRSGRAHTVRSDAASDAA